MGEHLVISCVGDDSLHRSWLQCAGIHEFDLLLVDFGSGAVDYSEDARWYMRATGGKYALITAAFTKFDSDIKQYESVWIPDDDLAGISHRDIVRMFAVFAETGFALAQPAIRRGYTAHHAVRWINGARWHETNFVEAMCPLFTQAALQKVRFTFRESHSGWGLDYWWPQLLKPDRVGVIDEISVIHTRFSNGRTPLYRTLAKQGIYAHDECSRVLRHFGVSRVWPQVISVHHTESGQTESAI